jgi:hypothetical protein
MHGAIVDNFINPVPVTREIDNIIGSVLNAIFNYTGDTTCDRAFEAKHGSTIYRAYHTTDLSKAVANLPTGEGAACIINNKRQIIRYNGVSPVNTKGSIINNIKDLLTNSIPACQTIPYGSEGNAQSNNHYNNNHIEATTEVIIPLAGWTVKRMEKNSYPGTGRNYHASREGGRLHNGFDFTYDSPGAPLNPGTTLYAVADGEITNIIHGFYNGSSAVEFKLDKENCRVLYGEVDANSAASLKIGQKISKGNSVCVTDHIMGGLVRCGESGRF